ncbi:hypothetical protein HK414_08835 [Ramlibacter terrae]|uniref:Lipoprotein n=1 Tax=Ramlibacter terrae TaxID=2732511 RepID=A0ABX6P4S2_9BURK|nr:hypothetical protein HK414_08835 [Ramlibacter terrae]
MAASNRRLAALFASVAVLAGGASAQSVDGFRNVTAGGPLRHGVYGRIDVPAAAAPPLIYDKPVVAAERGAAPGARPVYLYVPPGQVRKWSRHCAKWSACEQPVLFVRMDASPSRWGQWRQYREDVALQEREAH